MKNPINEKGTWKEKRVTEIAISIVSKPRVARFREEKWLLDSLSLHSQYAIFQNFFVSHNLHNDKERSMDFKSRFLQYELQVNSANDA